jgi:hypothetical protein
MDRLSHSRARSRRLLFLGLLLVGLVSVVARGGMLQAVWDALTGHRIEVTGAPVAASLPKLSEHNIEWVQTQPPQVQVEFLLSSAINHEQGATDLIESHVDGWRGQLARTSEWERLAKTALYSSDLRVRAAAIEIELAVNNVTKTDETAQWLIDAAADDEAARPFSAWTLGMLANRGVQPERIHDLLVEYTYDPDEETRFWAVEGLAHIGTDETIAEFIRILGTGGSLKVRERAGCSLAKSGMLTRGQRMKAVPGLIDLADDPSLEDQPRRWVYQALREITNVSLPDDPTEWRYWHSTDGVEARQSFDSEPWRVLGNS